MWELARTNKFSIFLGQFLKIFTWFFLVLLDCFKILKYDKVKMWIFGSWRIFKKGNMFVLIITF